MITFEFDGFRKYRERDVAPGRVDEGKLQKRVVFFGRGFDDELENFSRKEGLKRSLFADVGVAVETQSRHWSACATATRPRAKSVHLGLDGRSDTFADEPELVLRLLGDYILSGERFQE